MKTVMLVFGTRPEAIKMCPLVTELKTRKKLKTVVCVTGQHRQMLDQVLNTFNVIPDYDLSIMKQGQTLFDITTGILEKIKKVLEDVKPDVVLVHGDTSTTFVTALACFYLQIPVGHVEAGLRTYNIYSPYPEEFNRQAVGIISQYNFAPTQMAADNLIKEGKDPSKIFITGNTVIDAMQHTVRADYTHPELEWVGNDKLIFITAHRRENLGEPMHHMFRAIRRVLDEHPDSFPFVSAEEIGCISNYKDALLLFRMRELEEKDLRVVANYFSSVYRNQTETYDIMKYIVSLPMPMAHKLFYLLNRDKFSYMRMSKVHQNEMNKAFYDLFQMEEFPEECIEFMSFVHMDIPMMEKNLYIALNKDEVLRKKYVELINSLSVVSQEIIKNIQLMQTKYGYSEAINEKLFQQRDYETYVVSKTLKNSIFIFEKDKLDEIGETYKYIFNQSNYKVTQNYMMNNLEFMNWLVQEKAYEEADKTIQNYVAARQSSSLLKYVLGHMQEEQIVEYLSEINGFDGHESARFFVQSQDERKNLLVHPGIYNNCYEKLIDSGLKGWYTRIFKAAKKNV